MPITTAGISFVVYALTSLAWAPAINWLAVVNLFGMIVAYLAGVWLSNPRQVWTFFLWIGLAFAIDYILSPDVNPNYAGAFFALALAVALIELPLMAIPYAAALLYTQSRGAIIAGASAIIIRYAFCYPLACLFIAVGALIAVMEQKVLGGSMYQRIGVWQDTLSHLTLFGHGLGSFQAVYETFPVKTNMAMALAPHAYNDYLEVLFQFGIGGIFGLIFVMLIMVEGTGPRVVPVTFLILGLTYFPLSIPVVAQVFTFALGTLSQSLHANYRSFKWRAGD